MASSTASERELAQLTSAVEDAVDLLRILSKTKANHVVGKTSRLLGEELQLARGLAFLFVAKGGLIVSGLGGQGFIIKRLDTGRNVWSAPLLFNVSSLAIGVTVGYSKVDSLIILDTEHAVDNFLKSQLTLDTGVTVAAGPVARDFSSTELHLNHPNDTFSSVSYSVAHGGMIDVSFKGVRINAREDVVRRLYGANVSAADVLNGAVENQVEIQPLLEEIQLLTQGGSLPVERVVLH